MERIFYSHEALAQFGKYVVRAPCCKQFRRSRLCLSTRLDVQPMATIHQTPSSILQRRPRSPEIINVDELDDELLARPRQRRRVAQPSDRDVIVIEDSDDEDGSHAGPSQPREAIVVRELNICPTSTSCLNSS